MGFVWVGDLPITSQPTTEQQADCLNQSKKFEKVCWPRMEQKIRSLIGY